MSAVGIIPARFRASRFPGKPLATIAGRPMLAHVIEGARRAKKLREVIVATDDERIAAAAAALGAPVAMTSPDHPTGTDRLAEVAAQLSDAIVVNVQGDEPLIEGFVIDAAVEALEADAEAPMATVAHPLESDALADPNRVKVVLDRRGRALYFSRAPIPYRRADGPAPRWLQHVGLYAYRRPFLERFLALAPGEAERAEGLEQLRALEHGFAIRCAVIEGWQSVPVDVPADVGRVEAVLARRGR
jgi:3-deoxy-manno-octulosonate cytidylyltransferase (CMP-KDO synthetase)